jgi:hypothetical protein
MIPDQGEMQTQPTIPYMEILNFPYLTKLINDHIQHNVVWPTMPTKLPLDITKFEGHDG